MLRPRGTTTAVVLFLIIVVIASPAYAWVFDDVDVNRQAPFRCLRYQVYSGGTPANITCDAVPAGFRLVVEFVSMQITVPAGVVMWISLGVGPELPPVNSVFVKQERLPAGPEDWVIVSQPVRFYVEPGQILSVRSNTLTSGSHSRGYSVTIEGTLVPLIPRLP